MNGPLTPIVILTGAGISAESGIPTFRASDGLWENHRVEDVATPEGFERDAELVHCFYNARRRRLLSPEIQPNPAHRALAELERRWPGPAGVTVVTQNIDNLHERGGSKRVIHMHGELLKGFCTFCRVGFDVRNDLTPAMPCAACGRLRGLRPDVVWFGEMPYRMDEIYRLLAQCALFAAVGTSGNVYPAAGFAEAASRSGARTIEVNLEPSAVENAFHEHRYGEAGVLVPQLAAELLGQGAGGLLRQRPPRLDLSR